MEKIIKIDGKEYKAVANALIPRLYRFHFGRDIMQDMRALTTAYNNNKKQGQSFEINDLTMFENVAWLFFKLGGEDVKESPDEWLASLEMLSIYEVLPELIELWHFNLEQTSKPKKK